MKAKEPKKPNQEKDNRPENPTPPPSSLTTVLEVSADEGARVRRWAEQVRDASIQVEIQGSKLSLRGITPAELWCRVIMFETFGVTDSDLQSYLGRQVEQCFFNSALAESELQDRWAEIIRVARALLQGLAPRDSIEVQLAVQMIGVHNTAMEAIRRAGAVELPLEFRKHYANYAVKTMRLFLEQMEALRKHRGGGTQQVVVKHVQVNEGGQAIVGHIAAGRRDSQEDRT